MEYLQTGDRVKYHGDFYYVTEISDKFEETLCSAKNTSGEVMHFSLDDVGITVYPDNRYNVISQGLDEFLGQTIMGQSKHYSYPYGLYDGRFYRIPALDHRYAVWNRKSEIAHKFPEEIYKKIEYDSHLFVLPDHYTFWIRVGKKFSGTSLPEIQEHILSCPEMILSKKTEKKHYPFIINVREPIFQRFPENEKENTFDIIRIEILLRSYPEDERMQKCIEHKKELMDCAVQKLKESKGFRKYGIPVNFLKVYDMVLTCDNRVVLSLCLKELENGKNGI